MKVNCEDFLITSSVMLINNKGLFLCDKALVMELIEKLLVEHTDNNPTVDFPPLNANRLIKKEDSSTVVSS